MTKQLTIGDFKTQEFEGTEMCYFQYTFGNEMEICLEPCFEGFCVGLYNKKKDLIFPKKCTLLADSIPHSFERALVLANELMEELEK